MPNDSAPSAKPQRQTSAKPKAGVSTKAGVQARAGAETKASVENGAAAKPRARKGRPTAQESFELDERIKRGALDHFLQFGFEAATMDAIAQTVGITKRTLYARYTDKETLFQQVLAWAMVQWREVNIELNLPADAPLEEQLIQAAQLILQRELNEKVVKLGRIAALQTERFPSLRPADLSLSWSPRMQVISGILARHAEAGDLVVDDLEQATELFISLIVGIPTRLAAFGIYRQPEVEQARIRVAVAIFLNGIRASASDKRSVTRQSSKTALKAKPQPTQPKPKSSRKRPSSER